MLLCHTLGEFLLDHVSHSFYKDTTSKEKEIHTARCLAAARRTMGVSSEDKVAKSFRNSSRI